MPPVSEVDAEALAAFDAPLNFHMEHPEGHPLYGDPVR